MVALTLVKYVYLSLLVVLGPYSIDAFDPSALEKMMTPDMMENMKKMMTPDMMAKAQEAMASLQTDPSKLQDMFSPEKMQEMQKLMGGGKQPSKSAPKPVADSNMGNLASMLQGHAPPSQKKEDPLAGLGNMADMLKNVDPSQMEGSPFADLFKNIDHEKLQEQMKNFDSSKLQDMMKGFDSDKMQEMMKGFDSEKMQEMLKGFDPSKMQDMMKKMGLGNLVRDDEL